MSSLKETVEQAIMELIDDGKLVIVGPDGQSMDDLSIEIKSTDYDYDEDSEDESEEDSDEDSEDEE